MKILHLITNLGIGGAESFLCYLLKKFKNGKNEHYVIYFRPGSNVERIKKMGFSVYKISGLFCLYDPWFYFRLKKLIKKINPDVIHASLWSANIFGRFIAKKLSIPILCDLHNDCLYNGRFRNFLEKITITIPNKFIAVSYSIGKSFEENIINKTKKNSKRTKILDSVIVIPNGIDFSELKNKAFEKPLTRKEIGFKTTDFVIGSIGRLEPIKSYDILIQAFANLITLLTTEPPKKKALKQSDVKLCLVGDGSEKEKLKQLTKNLNISDKVFFADQQSKAYKFYPLFDCFALSSQTEGLSIATLEAMCFGLPIITSHALKTHEVVTDGQNGFLIQHKDIDAFAKTLKHLFSNPSLAADIGKNNQELVKTKFDINTAVTSYNQLYHKLSLPNSKIE